jgi:predicted transposase YbfD/YdcC
MRSFISNFEQLDDPRVPGLVTYPLNEILLCTLCGIICRATDWEEVSCWGKYHLKWLKKFLPFESGIPNSGTFARVFNAIDSKKFKACFDTWISDLPIKLNGKQVAIDGKTVRGSKLAPDGTGAAHIVSAFVHEYGLVIGQEKVNEKSNEITAIPELLTNLALEGSIISIDAIGTQKEIVKQIVNGKADYVLALKENQKSLYEDATLFLDNLDKDVIYDEYEDTDAGHGRIEVRNCKIVKDISWLNNRHPEWSNLRSIARVESVRIDKKTLKEQRQTRYYISSLASNAKTMLSYVRNHWSVENKLHWILDMNFKEDSCRTRIDHGAENLALIRKSALNLIRSYNPEGKKITVKRKMLDAMYDTNYLKSLLLANNL